MMLSASAARMGSVKTTLRQIGMVRRFTAATSRRDLASVGKRNKDKMPVRAVVPSDVHRWKSTMAAYTDSEVEEEIVWNKSHGHAEALKVRSTLSNEAWMVNLGRGDNNEWLLGSRNPDEWFTGLKPTLCPGKFPASKIACH